MSNIICVNYSKLRIIYGVSLFICAAAGYAVGKLSKFIDEKLKQMKGGD